MSRRILRNSPKFVLSIFSPRMAVNSKSFGKVCLWGNGLPSTSLRNVMLSAHISSSASSSIDLVYAAKNVARLTSERSEVNVDLRAGSRTLGLVRLYMALNRAGIVFLGLDPSKACNRLKTVLDGILPLDEPARCQYSTSVSRHSRASAAKRCSSMRRERFLSRSDA